MSICINRGINRTVRNNITTIIFDYGCVLTNPQDREIFNEIYNLVTDSDFPFFEEIYYNKRAAYDQGIISGREYWKQILSEFGSVYSDKLADKLIKLDAEAWSSFNMDIYNFIEMLKERNYKLAVLSNMPAEILEYLYKKSDIFDIFDTTVFSCDLKLIKPDPEIYRKALEIIGCSGSEAVFIDDRAGNVDAAVKEGIYAVRFTGFSSFEDEIRRYIEI